MADIGIYWDMNVSKSAPDNNQPSNQTLDHVAITPASATVVVGASQQFTAAAYDSAGNVISGVNSIWSVNADGSTINSAGLFTAGAVTGTFNNAVKAEATLGGIIKDAFATVTVGTQPVSGGGGGGGGPTVTLSSITVTPNTTSVDNGTTQQFTATGHYSDSSTRTITSLVAWSVVAATGNGTINSAGLFSATTLGTVTIHAAKGTISGDSGVITVAPVLTSIVIAPDTATIRKGDTQQFSATAHYSDASTADITSGVTWSVVAGTGAGTIDAAGLLSATAIGSVTIHATRSGISDDSGIITINPPDLTSIEITPDTATVTAGGAGLTFSLFGHYSDNTTVSIPAGAATWSVTAGTGTGVINGAALFTGMSAGTV